MKRPEDFAGIFIHRERVDMRKSINGLSEIVQESEMGDLRGPYLFVFSGRSKASIKVLYWDQTGFCLWYKRLEKDRFEWPRSASDDVMRLNAEQLDWLLRGLDILKIKPHAPQEYEDVG